MSIIILVVSLDDILGRLESKSLLEDFKAKKKKLFEVELLGEAKSFIGLELRRDKRGICASQERYLDKQLREYNLSNANPAETPLPTLCNLTARTDSESILPPLPYAKYPKSVAHLMYLAVASRPDTVFTASML